VFVVCYDGNDALVPEIWAHEAVQLLYENMVAANLVNRQFDSEIQDYGDVIHTSKPAESKVVRRTDDTPSDGLSQSTSSSDIQVCLNQWFNQSFALKQREMSLAFPDLVQKYLAPRMKTMARSIDRVILGVGASKFLGTPAKRAGRLGALTGTNAYDMVVEADKVLNDNKAPVDERNLIVSSATKAQLLLCDKFIKANERGDGGAAMKTGQIGHVLGFDTYMCQNISNVMSGADAISGTITAAHAAGSQDDQASSVVSAVKGEFAVVSGNDQPTWIVTEDAEGAGFTLNEANKYATLAGAQVTVYKACAAAASYAAGYSEEIVVSGYTPGNAPQIGQLIAFGITPVTRQTYTVIESTDAGATCAILLDRPLDVAVTAADGVFPGPYGSVNLAIHPNAITLVSRPLSVAHMAGIEFAIANIDGLGVRVAMQQKINEGLVVAIDLLAGVAVLDQNLCVPLLG
jgi:hypothetical protein